MTQLVVPGTFYENLVESVLLQIMDEISISAVLWLRRVFGGSKLAKQLDMQGGIDLLLTNSEEELGFALQVKTIRSEAVNFHQKHPDIPVIITGKHKPPLPLKEFRNAVDQNLRCLLAESPESWQPLYYQYYKELAPSLPPS